MDITSVLSTTIPTVIGAATGIFALYKGLAEYKKGIEQKKKEIDIRNQEMVQKRQERLFPLIKEFDESESMKFAKMILDDLPVSPNRSTYGIPDFRIKPEGLIPFLMQKPNTDWIKMVPCPIVKGNRIEFH